MRSGAAAAVQCNDLGTIIGACGTANVRNNGDSVDIGANSSSGGSSGSRGSSGGGEASDPAPRDRAGECFNRNLEVCRNNYTVTTPFEGRGPVTLADLASFRPQAGELRLEPDGWVVVGLPANPYIVPGVQVQAGSVVGVPASVRFTPVGYSWDFGDGSNRSTSSGGSSWEALGVEQFSTTETSHVYDRPGAVTIRVSVRFRAEYRFDGGAWTAVEGTLAVSSAPIAARAGSASTVLVERGCERAPAALGC